MSNNRRTSTTIYVILCGDAGAHSAPLRAIHLNDPEAAILPRFGERPSVLSISVFKGTRALIVEGGSDRRRDRHAGFL